MLCWGYALVEVRMKEHYHSKVWMTFFERKVLANGLTVRLVLNSYHRSYGILTTHYGSGGSSGASHKQAGGRKGAFPAGAVKLLRTQDV